MDNLRMGETCFVFRRDVADTPVQPETELAPNYTNIMGGKLKTMMRSS